LNVQLYVRLDDGLEREFLHGDSIGPGRKVRNIVEAFRIGRTGEDDVGLDVVASTFTPGITPPLGSVTRPVSVAVGPAIRQPANDIRSAKRW